jgi:hypothetical protein
MTHAIACLLHHVACRCTIGSCVRIDSVDLAVAIPEARRLGLIESPDLGRGAPDLYWVRLTPKGRNVADESLLAARVMIGEAP